MFDMYKSKADDVYPEYRSIHARMIRIVYLHRTLTSEQLNPFIRACCTWGYE